MFLCWLVLILVSFSANLTVLVEDVPGGRDGDVAAWPLGGEDVSLGPFDDSVVPGKYWLLVKNGDGVVVYNLWGVVEMSPVGVVSCLGIGDLSWLITGVDCCNGVAETWYSLVQFGLIVDNVWGVVPDLGIVDLT